MVFTFFCFIKIYFYICAEYKNIKFMIDPNNIDFSKLEGFKTYPTAEQVENFPTKRFTVWDQIKLAIKRLLPPEGVKRGRIGFIQSNLNLSGKPQFFENGSKIKTKDLFNIY